jgi:uroporphyrinogen decarboxylase
MQVDFLMVHWHFTTAHKIAGHDRISSQKRRSVKLAHLSFQHRAEAFAANSSSRSDFQMKPMIASALGLKPTRRPVWFMRQAGRYLPEYRVVRAGVEFTELCKSPKLATEVTIQPLRRYDLDAAIIFSDILVPCMAMGQELTFDKGHGPRLSNAVRGQAEFARLRKPDCEKELGFVGEAIAQTKALMRPEQTMIGFAGAPFTVASYMIEGAGSKEFTEVKKLLYTQPETFRSLLQLLGDVTIEYLLMQKKSGADIVMLFDTWAGQLTCPDYVEHVLPVTKRVTAAVKSAGLPVIYYPGQGSDRMYELGGMNIDVISVDWRTRLSRAGQILRGAGLDVTLQGNLDPQILIGPEAMVRSRTRAIIAEGEQSARAHIFNVGHGLLPHTPPDALTWVIDELRK